MKSIKSSRRSRISLFEPLESRTLFSVFYVTNVNDSGAGSLRQAITNLNYDSANTETIDFAIAPYGLSRTITLKSALPVVTHGNVTIDGHTQTTSAVYPITLAGSGLTLSGSGEIVSALSINAGSGNDIELENGGSSSVQGCNLVTPLGGNGILVYNSSFNKVGETTDGGPASQANTITGIGGGNGIFFEGSGDYNAATGDIISGCFVGIQVGSSMSYFHLDDNRVSQNTLGILNLGADGGLLGNIISANHNDGLYDGGFYTNINTNDFISNMTNGIEISGASAQDQVYNNWISGNRGDGIIFDTSALAPKENGPTIIEQNRITQSGLNGILLANTTNWAVITQNMIFSNTKLGIARQAGDDTSTNVANITGTTLFGNNLEISYNIHGTAGTYCNLEFFVSNPGTTSDGLTYIGAAHVQLDSNGNYSGNVTLTTTSSFGVVTATVTNPFGTGMFSNPAAFTPFSITWPGR